MPIAWNAADLSSEITLVENRPERVKAMERGAFREPGEITTSLTFKPNSISASFEHRIVVRLFQEFFN